MCDDFTEQADIAADAKALTRRQFTAIGAAAVLVGSSAATNPSLTEAMVRVTAPDGLADAFFVHPAKGKHPGIILWPDIGGMRDAFKVMARRLAASGYAVLVVNQYYRSSPAPVLASFAQWRTPEGQTKLKPMLAEITPVATARDAAAFVRYLDASPAVDTQRKIGSNGYCISGGYAVRTAAAAPKRVGAAASFHGANLVSNDADSPAHLLAASHASFLFAIARNDDARAPGDKDALRAAATAAKRPADIAVYAADHGWCVGDAPSYNAAEADRAWGKLLALFAKL